MMILEDIEQTLLLETDSEVPEIELSDVEEDERQKGLTVVMLTIAE